MSKKKLTGHTLICGRVGNAPPQKDVDEGRTAKGSCPYLAEPRRVTILLKCWQEPITYSFNQPCFRKEIRPSPSSRLYLRNARFRGQTRLNRLWAYSPRCWVVLVRHPVANNLSLHLRLPVSYPRQILQPPAPLSILPHQHAPSLRT